MTGVTTTLKLLCTVAGCNLYRNPAGPPNFCSALLAPSGDIFRAGDQMRLHGPSSGSNKLRASKTVMILGVNTYASTGAETRLVLFTPSTGEIVELPLRLFDSSKISVAPAAKDTDTQEARRAWATYLAPRNGRRISPVSVVKAPVAPSAKSNSKAKKPRRALPAPLLRPQEDLDFSAMTPTTLRRLSLDRLRLAADSAGISHAAYTAKAPLMSLVVAHFIAAAKPRKKGPKRKPSPSPPVPRRARPKASVAAPADSARNQRRAARQLFGSADDETPLSEHSAPALTVQPPLVPAPSALPPSALHGELQRADLFQRTAQAAPFESAAMLEAQVEDLLRRRTLAAQAASAAPTASSFEAQLEDLLRQRTLAAQTASSAAPVASMLEAQLEVLLQRRAHAAPSATLSLAGLLQGYMPPAPDMRQVGCHPFHAAYRPPALDLHHLLELQTQQAHQQQQLLQLQLLLSGLHRGQVEPPSPRFSLPYQPPAQYYSPQPAAHVFSPSPVHYLSPGYHQAPVQSSPLDELMNLLAASGRRL